MTILSNFVMISSSSILRPRNPSPFPPLEPRSTFVSSHLQPYTFILPFNSSPLHIIPGSYIVSHLYARLSGPMASLQPPYVMSYATHRFLSSSLYLFVALVLIAVA
jgi:hypothetical protein